MNITTLSDLIAQLGFPIVCCIYLAWSNEKLRGTLEKNTNMIESLKQMIFDLHNKED